MKKIIILLPVVCCLLGTAQQNKKTTATVATKTSSASTGRWFVGNTGIMSLSYYSSKTTRTKVGQNSTITSKDNGTYLSLPFQARLGNAELGTYKNTDVENNLKYSSKQNTVGIFLSPEIGRHITDKISAGAQLVVGIGRSKTNYSQTLGNQTGRSETINRNRRFGLGPFIQYYFKGRDQRWSPYVMLVPFVSWNKSNGNTVLVDINNITTKGGSETKSTYWSVRPAAGIQRMLGKRFSFDISAGYYYQQFNQDESNESNNTTTKYKSKTTTHYPAIETGLRYML
jgi:hypothetical protein